MRILADLQRKNVVLDRGFLAGSVPPPLMREGQKVQPQWLFDFLQQPHEIRPAVAANLKMPRFNLSDVENEALVNYFIAVDRIQNPALGLEYFGRRPPQRDPAFQTAKRDRYRHRVTDFMKDAPNFNASKADYFESGWQMLVDKNLCVKCHNIGAFQAEGKAEEKGPALSMTADRLRPEYVERWISFPKRLVPYTIMPQYDPFYAPDAQYHHLQDLLRRQDVRRMVELGPVLGAQAAPRGPFIVGDDVYNQLELQFAVMPADKVRAVRDALMSWGYLIDPPPTARAAGPRIDPPQGEKKP
jgi:cbb3-type cytochrome oxidase cytochrome c subunit